MNDYCEDLHMQASVAKTQVIVLGGHTNHTFTCANRTVEQVEDFKYLGFHFHQSGHIKCEMFSSH